MERTLNPSFSPGPTETAECRSRAGMSLVEVTLALGITSFAAVVIMGLLATALNHNSESVKRSVIVKIYQNVSESIKTSVANTPPDSGSWQKDLYYTREAVGCGAADDEAHYHVLISASVGTVWPGNTLPHAWNIDVQIKSIPKGEKTIFERHEIVVKKPQEAP